MSLYLQIATGLLYCWQLTGYRILWFQKRGRLRWLSDLEHGCITSGALIHGSSAGFDACFVCHSGWLLVLPGYCLGIMC